MRRATIYPHRSVRSIHLTGVRILMALVVAVGLMTSMYVIRQRLLLEHNRISTTVLEFFGVPLVKVTNINIFAPLGAAEAAVPDGFHLKNDPWRVYILFVCSTLGLLVIHRRVELARNFVVFLIVLILVGTGVMIFSQSFEIGPTEFTQIWLRQEVLVWLLLPWFSASLFVLMQPALWSGLLWSLAVEVYAFVWSAVRLAFCLAVLHYSGLLFVPLLWFGLGMLADVIYILVFFSLSTHQAAGRAWGRRMSWQS